jgi:hypothetical protein
MKRSDADKLAAISVSQLRLHAKLPRMMGFVPISPSFLMVQARK